MALEEVTKWGTFIGAIVAAIASLINLWWKHRENSDNITVGFGLLRPQISPGYGLYVISKSNHRIIIQDYGFINESGALISLPQLFVDEVEDTNDTLIVGSTIFENRNESYEVLLELRDKQIGAYALIAGQSSYSVKFSEYIPWHKRIWIRLKIKLNRRFQ